MRKKTVVSLILVAVFLLTMSGSAYALDFNTVYNQVATNWDKDKTSVGQLEKADMPGYDFVLVNGSNRTLLVPAGQGIASELAAGVNNRVMVRGDLIKEKFSRRMVMEVKAVRLLSGQQYQEMEKEVVDDVQSVTDSVYNPGAEPGDFDDLGQDHGWAMKAIREMVKRKVLTGVGNNRFEPDNQITRAQFATILVKGLGKTVSAPSGQTFADVKPGDWCYNFVETAKSYLTGFKLGDGTVMFYPNLPAVREDMAVAIIKARGLAPATDLTVLDQFSDKNRISENLRPYVAAAVSGGMMRGYEDGAFRPQGKLTRAEAAVLMYKVMQAEKIVM